MDHPPDPPDFNLNDSSEIGHGIITLKQLTGHPANHCADMIFSQNADAKSLLFGNSSRGDTGATIPIQ